MTELPDIKENPFPLEQDTAEQHADTQTLELIRFSGSDREARQLLARMPNTVSYGSHEFPALQQYYEMVAQIDSQPGSADEKKLAALAQRSWHVRGQNGCNFARIAAAHAEGLIWDYTVCDPDVHALDQCVVREIGVTLDRAIEDPETQIHSVLLPGITDVRRAVEAIGLMADHSKFWLERNEVTGGLLRLNLRYPVGETGIQAWVMAFGPFEFLPNTRKAPYFELAIRVKPKPPKIFYRLNQDASVAHLADAHLGLSDEAHEPIFERTLTRTREILGGEPDDVSAAKATLSIPVGLLL